MKSRLLLVQLFLTTILFASDGISGKVYYHLAMPTADGSYNEFAIARIYFGYEIKIQENIKVKLLTDVAKPLSGEGWRLYQKNAYLQYASPFGDIILGLQGMNIFNVVEANWGYRFVDKQSMDAHKFAASADMGIGFLTTLADKIHLHFTITNGGGYKTAESNKSKKFAAQVVYGPKKLGLKKGFNFGIAYSHEPDFFQVFSSQNSAQKALPSTPITLALNVGNSSVGSIFGAFATPVFRIGAEYDWKGAEALEYIETIIAAYANVKIMDNLHGFARLEIYDPVTTTDNNEETGIIAGVNWLVASNFKVAPNIHYDSSSGGEGSLTAIMINVEFNY